MIPMLLFVGWMGKHGAETGEWPYQVFGLFLLLGMPFLIPKKAERFFHRLFSVFSREHELHIFLGLFLCFGCAIISEFFGLLSGLGAFAAGLVVARLGGSDLVGERLHSSHAFFLALFFVSVGMLINIPFFLGHAGLVLTLTLLVFFGNTAISTFLFRAFGETWERSVFGGAMLAQI